jgi:hypothetical protein
MPPTVGCPANQVELKPLVENVADELDQVAIEAEVIAPDNRADSAQVVGEFVVSEERIGISELSNVPEPQQDRNPGVITCPHKNDAVVVRKGRRVLVLIRDPRRGSANLRRCGSLGRKRCRILGCFWRRTVRRSSRRNWVCDRRRLSVKTALQGLDYLKQPPLLVFHSAKLFAN